MSTDPLPAHPQPDALHAASQHKAEKTRALAANALARLRSTGAEITFASVAREAGVSQRYLYTQSDFAQQIRKLRPAAARQPLPEASDTESGIVSVLRARLRQQENTISDLHDTIRGLKRELEIAHGEIIKLRSRPRPGGTL